MELFIKLTDSPAVVMLAFAAGLVIATFKRVDYLDFFNSRKPWWIAGLLFIFYWMVGGAAEVELVCGIVSATLFRFVIAVFCGFVLMTLINTRDLQAELI